MHADDTFDHPRFLYLALGSGREVAIIFSSVPLALTGGVLALLLRGIPFSISVGGWLHRTLGHSPARSCYSKSSE